MTFSVANLRTRLNQLEALAGKANRYIVAFSGGVDSTALLHCMTKLLSDDSATNAKLLAVHINHHLHAESGHWAEQCRDIAASQRIEFRAIEVFVPKTAGKGLEAAARTARYAALEAELDPGDWLMTAHHQDDQAETLLLNLLRGSGPAGIAGIGAARKLGRGWLVRPLLDLDHESLVNYATNESLHWLDDPSNSDRRFDRNFLRHEVVPRFAARWPNVASRLQRSANRASEAAGLLLDLARMDVLALGGETSRLPIDGLAKLPPARQRNVIRFALGELGLTLPNADTLERVITEVIPARVDAQPLVTWSGASARRFRNALYLLPEMMVASIEPRVLNDIETGLGPGLGRLRLLENADVGLSTTLVSAGLKVRARQGGEEFQPQGQAHTRKLKKLLQEYGVVPWMRDRLPLLYCGERLVAVGDLWMASDAVSIPGVAVEWIDRPALH